MCVCVCKEALREFTGSGYLLDPPAGKVQAELLQNVHIMFIHVSYLVLEVSVFEETPCRLERLDNAKYVIFSCRKNPIYMQEEILK